MIISYPLAKAVTSYRINPFVLCPNYDGTDISVCRKTCTATIMCSIVDHGQKYCSIIKMGLWIFQMHVNIYVSGTCTQQTGGFFLYTVYHHASWMHCQWEISLILLILTFNKSSPAYSLPRIFITGNFLSDFFPFVYSLVLEKRRK